MIIINFHSFVDIITNSSTELFVVENSTTIETIKEMLQFMLDHWNQLAAGGAFGDHYIVNKRVSLNGREKPSKPIKTYDETFGDIYFYTQEIYDRDEIENEKWEGKFFSSAKYQKKENVGKIIIEGAFDNSIPSEMCEWIEKAFGYETQRFHLG